MILLLAVGIAILFLLCIFLAGIIGAWLVEHFFGLGE
jgi:uncharacterized membrane protein